MIKPQEIEKARQTIQKMVHLTPILTSDSISARVGLKVYLKLENLQKTGSFKIRGAYYKISKLVSSLDVKGVVAASAGNHAQGVALAASSHGVTATIVMPERAPYRNSSPQGAMAHGLSSGGIPLKRPKDTLGNWRKRASP